MGLFSLMILRSNAQTSACQPPLYYFNNLSSSTGSGGVNSTYTFSSVINGVNAKFTITKLQNASITNSNMDQSSPYPQAWQPFITFPSRRTNASDTSYIEFKLQFLSTGSNPSLVNQSCMALTIIDLDGDGNNSYREMVKISNPGTPLGINNSTITVVDDSKWMFFKSGTATFNNIDTANKAAMSQVNFPSTVNTIYMRVGVVGPVSANTTRQFSFYFKSFTGLVIPLPVHVFDYKVSRVSEMAQLSWKADQAVNFSHYEVYRSLNGIDFTQVSEKIVGNNDRPINEFVFNDPITHLSAPNVFYKIKMVDMDGRSAWTSLRVLGLYGQNAGISEIYPNPSNQFVNVTFASVPTEDGKLEIVDAYGKLVKSYDITDSESDAMTIDVAGLQNGIYFFRVSDANGVISTSRFAKF